ncbi:MAG: ribbon-helix-helix domain-containing protein [Deltaproteobacteria bacterium]|nr:ribbon-helix-helix domain-containing protein [Deltaproteobacteria bacterium]MBW1795501.1 ribbon-helix-helix domain-containing protein [Deltaproteobacteria bacterium]MBW2034491.1 ribbon-helix-helix domain-containing protein [Deltaproteobacteria bacterium]
MGKTPEKSYINTTVNSSLLKSLKVLAAKESSRLNQLLEEAIQDLLKKYEKKGKKIN